MQYSACVRRAGGPLIFVHARTHHYLTFLVTQLRGIVARHDVIVVVRQSLLEDTALRLHAAAACVVVSASLEIVLPA